MIWTQCAGHAPDMTNSRPLRFAVSTALAVGAIGAAACDSGNTGDKRVNEAKEPEPEPDTVNEGPQVEPEEKPGDSDGPTVNPGPEPEPEAEDAGEDEPDHVNEGPKEEPEPTAVKEPKRTNTARVPEPKPAPEPAK